MKLQQLHRGILKGKSVPFFLAGLVVLLVVASPGKSRALELGLTPSHAFSIWLDINRSLLAYAKIVSGDEKKQAELEAMQPQIFKGKVPADVYGLAEKVTARLQGHIHIPTDTPDWLIEHEHEQILVSHKPVNLRITPSAVFLISTHLLNGIVDVVVRHTGWEQSVSDLYAAEQHFDKTPSDVFGLTDLALRRLEIILADQP